MVKKKAEPVITYTEILAIAGEHIRDTVLNLRKEVERVEGMANTPERKEIAQKIIRMNEDQQLHHMERLKAIETLYRIQTGTELGLTDALVEEDEDQCEPANCWSSWRSFATTTPIWRSTLPTSPTTPWRPLCPI